LLRSALPAANPAPGVPSGTPRPTTPPVRALLTSNINFGAVRINGQLQRGTLPMFFTLRAKTIYSIIIEAAPFQIRSCTVTFDNNTPRISSPDGYCWVGSGDLPRMTANGINATARYQVEIDFSLTDLPPNQQDNINTLLSQS